LSARDRINIASVEDTAVFEFFLDEWLAGIPSQGILEIDVTNETVEYKQSIPKIIARISDLSG
jgi:hypothetical protein